MRLTTPIYKLKRRARDLSRRDGIALHAALDQTARAEGFTAWSHLASHHATRSEGLCLLERLSPGEMILLAARPGQGKTALALEMAQHNHARGAWVFTLDYTRRDVTTHMAGEAAHVVIDTSDEICAAHIIARVGPDAHGKLIVVDYLQLLDQRRSNPPVDDQMRALRAYARAHGAIVVMISQVDRRFDLGERDMPGLADIRLPNPLDLGLFDWACFLHRGQMQVERIT